MSKLRSYWIVLGLGDPDDLGDAVLRVDRDALAAAVQTHAERAGRGQLDVERRDLKDAASSHESNPSQEPGIGRSIGLQAPISIQ